MITKINRLVAFLKHYKEAFVESALFQVTINNSEVAVHLQFATEPEMAAFGVKWFAKPEDYVLRVDADYLMVKTTFRKSPINLYMTVNPSMAKLASETFSSIKG